MHDVALDSVHEGDCLPWLSALPDESVDCIISSPPYNIGKAYEKRAPLADYLDQQRDVLAHCVRVLKESGSIFWQVGSYSNGGSLIPLDVRLFPILEGLGLIPRNRIVWLRQHGLHATKKFSARHETILWFTKSDAYKFFLDPIRVPQKYQNKRSWRGDNKGELTCNPDGKNPGDIWIFQNVKHNHEEQTIHPAQFPEDMVARMLLSTTEPNDLVLDPYMGAGTVAVVARDNNRHFLGAEMDPDYFQTLTRRLAGTPDEFGTFPNLKTLRDYCDRHGLDPGEFRFDVQTGSVATGRDKAKRFSESHHLEELWSRLETEESAFADRLRGVSDGKPDIERFRSKSQRTGESKNALGLFDLGEAVG